MSLTLKRCGQSSQRSSLRITALVSILSPSTFKASLNVKNGKIPDFDGDKESVPVWWLTFVKPCKFHKALKDNSETDLPQNEVEAATDTDTQKTARLRNDHFQWAG
jgi:hypothetical protein